MKITARRFQVTKRHALTISRGTSSGSENLLIEVEHEGVKGHGEMAPTTGGAMPETAAAAEAQALGWREALAPLAPWDLQRIFDSIEGSGAPLAALDMALHDWIGRRLGVPVWRLFGLDTTRIAPTSLTVGINPPHTIREIVPEILARTGARALKVKLGSPQGADADRESLAAAQEAADRPVQWRVDANGGWSLETARSMVRWVAGRDVELVEQPLARGQEADLAALRPGCPLPIYLDESIATAADVPGFAPHIDGINLKLMKCGGLREAVRTIHTARACGLGVMIGCMSESSLAITAAAHISPLADALDLDSHLNLVDDPFEGADYRDGRVVPNDRPGLGITLRNASTRA